MVMYELAVANLNEQETFIKNDFTLEKPTKNVFSKNIVTYFAIQEVCK